MKSLLRNFFEYNNNDQNLLTKKVFGSYKDFEIELKAIFGKVDKKRAVKRQFIKLKQTGLVLYYAMQFYQIISRLY